MKTRDDYWKALRLAILSLMAEDEGDEAPSWVSFVLRFGQGWRREYPNGPAGLEITGMNGELRVCSSPQHGYNHAYNGRSPSRGCRSVNLA